MPPVEDILASISAASARRPKTVLLVALIFSALCLGLASEVEVSTSRSALIEPGTVHMDRYQDFIEEFGIPEDLVVVVEAPTAELVHGYADAIGAALEKLPEVGEVFYRFDLEALGARAPFYMESEQVAMLQTLAATDAVQALRFGDGGPARLAALAELFQKAPGIATKAGGGADAKAGSQEMAAGLGWLMKEMKRIAGGDAGPFEPLDPERLKKTRADAIGNAGMDAEGYLGTDGGRIGVLFVRAANRSDEITVIRPFITAVRGVCEGALGKFPGLTYGLTGVPASQFEEVDSLRHDTVSTAVVALAGVIFLFLLFFPALRLLLIALAPILVGASGMGATIALAIGYINLISSSCGVVVIGLGVDFSIHIISRYLEARAAGFGQVEAAEEGVRGAGRGVLTGAITSAGAFFAVSFVDFPGLADLALASSAGLVVTLVAAFTVLPALLALFGPPSTRARQGFPGTRPAVRFLLRFHRLVLPVGLALTALLGWMSTKVDFDYSIVSTLPADSEALRYYETMSEHRDLSPNAITVVVDDLEAARALAAKLGELPTVHRAVSAADFVPEGQAARLKELAAIAASLKKRGETRGVVNASADGVVEAGMTAAATYDEALTALGEAIEHIQDLAFSAGQGDTVTALETALEEVEATQALLAKSPTAVRAGLERFTRELAGKLSEGADALDRTLAKGAFTAADMPAQIQARFVSSAGRYAVYAYPVKPIWNRADLGVFVAETRGVAGDVTGFPETYWENAALIVGGFRNSALYAALAVFCLLMFDLRRLRRVFLAAVPLACGTVWMLGLMRLFGVDYNLANIVGVPVIIGVGIDNGVHLLHRFLQDRDVEDAVVHTGGAIVLSSMTTMIGFGSLMVASHRGLASIGSLLAIGVGACMVTTIVVLPSLLLVINRGPSPAPEAGQVA